MPNTDHRAIDELASPERARRQHAALELERLGTREALTAVVLANFRGEIDYPLTQKLVSDLDSPDAEVRRAAADIFGAYLWNDPAAIGSATHSLVRALRDADRGVQISAAFALGVFGGADAVSGLMDALIATSDAGLKVVIIKALGTTQSESLILPLRELADGSSSKCVRVAAQKALDRINGAKF